MYCERCGVPRTESPLAAFCKQCGLRFPDEAPRAQGPQVFYHATNLEAALLIQTGGFRVDLSGSNAGARLGPGVYCTVTLQKAMQYCRGPHGGIVFELQVDLGKCKKLEPDDPLMSTWQQNGYDSAWAPADSGGIGLEENCIKDPGKVRIKQAFTGHTFKLRQAGYHIVDGRIEAIGDTASNVRPRCNVPGCSRETWNGQPGEPCCRTCKSSGSAEHGPDCNRKHGHVVPTVPVVPVAPVEVSRPAVENRMHTEAGVISAEAAAGCCIGVALPGCVILSHESANGPDELVECVLLPIPGNKPGFERAQNQHGFVNTIAMAGRMCLALIARPKNVPRQL